MAWDTNLNDWREKSTEKDESSMRNIAMNV